MRWSVPRVDGYRAAVLLPNPVQFLCELLDAPLGHGVFGDTARVPIGHLTDSEVLRNRAVPVIPVGLHLSIPPVIWVRKIVL